jgi:hypothetical protein
MSEFQGSLFAINAQDAIHQVVQQACLNGYGYREEVVAKSGNYSFLVHFHQSVEKQKKCADQFLFYTNPVGYDFQDSLL